MLQVRLCNDAEHIASRFTRSQTIGPTGTELPLGRRCSP